MDEISARARSHLAIHESAHATVALELGIEVERVEIDFAKIEGFTKYHNRGEADLITNIAITIGGCMGERLIRGSKLMNTADDYAKIKKYLEPVPEAEQSATLAQGIELAEYIPMAHIDAVRRLANELLARGRNGCSVVSIKGEELETIVEPNAGVDVS
jgi:hypothetical protein